MRSIFAYWSSDSHSSQNLSLIAYHSKANNCKASISRKERYFNQKSSILSGFQDKVDSFPETSSEDSAYPWQFSFFFFIPPFIFISWRLITLQYCSGFCHTLTWISHGFTCIPHPDPPSHLPLYLIPLGNRSPAQVGCMRQVLRPVALGWTRAMTIFKGVKE